MAAKQVENLSMCHHTLEDWCVLIKHMQNNNRFMSETTNNYKLLHFIAKYLAPLG